MLWFRIQKIQKKCYYFYYVVLINVFSTLPKLFINADSTFHYLPLLSKKVLNFNNLFTGFFWSKCVNFIPHPFLTISWLKQHECLIRIVYLVITICSHKKVKNCTHLRKRRIEFSFPNVANCLAIAIKMSAQLQKNSHL